MRLMLTSKPLSKTQDVLDACPDVQMPIATWFGFTLIRVAEFRNRNIYVPTSTEKVCAMLRWGLNSDSFAPTEGATGS